MDVIYLVIFKQIAQKKMNIRSSGMVNFAHQMQGAADGYVQSNEHFWKWKPWFFYAKEINQEYGNSDFIGLSRRGARTPNLSSQY